MPLIIFVNSYITVYRRTIMEINQIIAANPEKLRTERNLSLGQLSLACDASKVLLSQIEKSDSNPTVNTIWKIANGLKVPYSLLLEQPVHDTSIIKKSQIAIQEDDESHYRIYCFHPNTPTSISNFSRSN